MFSKKLKSEKDSLLLLILYETHLYFAIFFQFNQHCNSNYFRDPNATSSLSWTYCIYLCRFFDFLKIKSNKRKLSKKLWWQTLVENGLPFRCLPEPRKCEQKMHAPFHKNHFPEPSNTLESHHMQFCFIRPIKRRASRIFRST